MKCKIYATDEGFGPLVRQSAVIEELRALDPELEIAFQTHAHVDDARWILQDVALIDRFNNITWSKNPDGSPDVGRIEQEFSDYDERSEAFVRAEIRDFDYDFVVSDFVYEAFPVARRRGVPSFGVAHFTWDWFFSKLHPAPLTRQTLHRLRGFAELADVLYFPPFTPREILNSHAHKVREVPLIVRKHVSKLPDGLAGDRFKVLVIDSGSQLLREHLREALRDVEELSGDYHFFVTADLGVTGENVTEIHEKEWIIDHIPHVDLVIARAGFNTISECIAFRTPMLLVGEAMNPEMTENMVNLQHEGLASFVSLDRFTRTLPTLLPQFVEHEYQAILQAMREHEIPTDGARVIAEEILERVHGRLAATGT